MGSTSRTDPSLVICSGQGLRFGYLNKPIEANIDTRHAGPGQYYSYTKPHIYWTKWTRSEYKPIETQIDARHDRPGKYTSPQKTTYTLDKLGKVRI